MATANLIIPPSAEVCMMDRCQGHTIHRRHNYIRHRRRVYSLNASGSREVAPLMSLMMRTTHPTRALSYFCGLCYRGYYLTVLGWIDHPRRAGEYPWCVSSASKGDALGLVTDARKQKAVFYLLKATLFFFSCSDNAIYILMMEAGWTMRLPYLLRWWQLPVL